MAVNHLPYGPGAMNPLSLCRGDESSLYIYIEAMNSLSLSLCRGDECQGDESSLSLWIKKHEHRRVKYINDPPD